MLSLRPNCECCDKDLPPACARGADLHLRVHVLRRLRRDTRSAMSARTAAAASCRARSARRPAPQGPVASAPTRPRPSASTSPGTAASSRPSSRRCAPSRPSGGSYSLLLPPCAGGRGPSRSDGRVGAPAGRRERTLARRRARSPSPDPSRKGRGTTAGIAASSSRSGSLRQGALRSHVLQLELRLGRGRRARIVQGRAARRLRADGTGRLGIRTCPLRGSWRARSAYRCPCSASGSLPCRPPQPGLRRRRPRMRAGMRARGVGSCRPPGRRRRPMRAELGSGPMNRE